MSWVSDLSQAKTMTSLLRFMCILLPKINCRLSFHTIPSSPRRPTVLNFALNASKSVVLHGLPCSLDPLVIASFISSSKIASVFIQVYKSLCLNINHVCTEKNIRLLVHNVMGWLWFWGLFYKCHSLTVYLTMATSTFMHCSTNVGGKTDLWLG